jgi:proteasome assembly chaperone (PAC2) family protein
MLSSGGATISTDRPEGGVIGLAGLLSSLGPVYGVSSGCIISTSIGNSVDIHSAERMRLALQDWLNVDLPIPISTTEAIAERIEKLMAEHPDSSLGRELLEDNSTSLYA